MDQKHGIVLTEIEIRRINKDILSKLSRDPDPDVVAVEATLQNILRTTEEVRLENTHRAAACDALCGLLRNGASSPVVAMRELCTSYRIWSRSLAMYLDRNNDARARPMKQVLETLLRVLQGMPSDELGEGIKCLYHAIHLCLGYLLDENSAGYARPAMFLLNNFVSKKLTRSSNLVEAMASIKSNHSVPGSFSGFERFVYFILLWARNPDIAPVCGKFLASFCSGNMSFASASETSIANQRSAVWAKPVRELLREYPHLIGVLEQDILPDLLRLNPEASAALLHELPFQDLLLDDTGSIKEADLRLCLLLLRVNGEHNFASFEDEFAKSTISDTVSSSAGPPLSISERVSFNLLRHSNPDVRLAALSIITSPTLVARPLTQAAVELLSVRIWDFFDETDARVRNDFLSLTRRLFTKLEAIALRVSKMEAGSTNSEGRHVSRVWPVDDLPVFKNLLLANLRFLVVFQERILSQLIPTASYQRHILALKTLTYFQSIQLPVSTLQLVPALRPKRWLVRSLLDLIMDPFEDVRSMAAGLLPSFSPDLELLQITVDNATRLMRASGRADNADGYGRLIEVYQRRAACIPTTNGSAVSDTIRSGVEWQPSVYVEATFAVLDEVDQHILVATRSLERAVIDAPLHGKIIALRYLISSPEALSFFSNVNSSDQLNKQPDLSAESSTHDYHSSVGALLVSRIVETCRNCWNLVYPILCIDSPEGTNFLAEDEEDVSDIGIKDTLSYSWRALKESVLLLQALIRMGTQSLAVDDEALRSIGHLLFAQLAQLRHRGAFSAVAQTYATFCALCETAATSGARSLMVKLYEDTLACIQAKSTALTRRSAGLPALTVGLLCANPRGVIAARAFKDLQRISTQPIGDGVTRELPQVHALNCLKDIFTNSKLGPATEDHLSKVLVIAVDCLDTDLWAIRNSGLMLLKALLLRLEEGRLKSNAAYQQAQRGQYSKTAYGKHPALATVVMELLRKASRETGRDDSLQQQTRLIEKTFPAIEVIERVGVPPAIAEEVKELLSRHLGDAVWAMRNKTAGCLALLLDELEIVARIEETNHTRGGGLEGGLSNFLHGQMLLVRHAIRERRINVRANDLALALVGQIACFNTGTVSAIVQELFHDNVRSLYKLGIDPTVLEVYAQTYRINTADLSSFQERKGSAPLLAESEQAVGHYRTFATCLDDGHTSTLSILAYFVPFGSEAFYGALAALRDIVQKPSASDIDGICQLVYNNLSNFKPSALVSVLEYISENTHSCVAEASNDVRKTVATHMLALLQKVFQIRTDTSVMNRAVELWGTVAGLTYASGGQSQADQSVIEAWYGLISNAMNEQADFDIREAAIDSVIKFQEILADTGTERLDSLSTLPLIFVIYDGLVDDDEEIRLKSAQCASWALAAVKDANWHRSDLSPAAARSELIQLLNPYGEKSQTLAQEALRRVLGSMQGIETSFASSLRLGEDKSTALFAEERQNQFIDEFQDSQSWAHIAKHCSGLPALIDQRVLTWVQEGLEHLRAILIANHRLEAQGPLGTFSRIENFLLVARLLIAADLVIHFRQAICPSNADLMEVICSNARSVAETGTGGRLPSGMLNELFKLIINSV